MFDKTMGVARKYGAKVAAAGSAAYLGMGVAFAQATDPFDTAVATIQTKVEGYGGALVALAAVAVVFLVGIKYVKKIPKAS